LNIDLDADGLKKVRHVEEAIFRCRKSQVAARAFIKKLKEGDFGMSQSELAQFAKGLTGYSQEAFYTVTLRRLRGLGLVELATLRGGGKRYIPRCQPVTRNPPSPQSSLPALIWQVCQLWNREFWPEG